MDAYLDLGLLPEMTAQFSGQTPTNDVSGYTACKTGSQINF